MKKITDFMVEKRNYILIGVTILCLICLFLGSKVNVNKDMAKYLPDNSTTKIGMDIMDDEFKEVESSSLNLMFKDLEKDKKNSVYKWLSSLKGVDEVNYDNSKNYNKDGYTLYVITVKDTSDSELAKNVYDKILKKYENYQIYTSGDIDDENKTLLPVWIVFLAIFCALIILIIMCDSYLEPILFLIAIGMAVILNKGTNIIFPSISNITSSITAILQLALSMDYSIMLLNRYRQEKGKSKNDVEAMKKALYHSFSSISSSSVTTVVGLLALVFMSFKIGKDLGLVLAKGVLFSLFTIFTCLPALILMFDNLIEKSRKKSPKINLDKLGKFAYKNRYLGIGLFALIFIISFMLKGNLGILYTASETDDVAKVFNTNNQIALIYKKEDEKRIASYCSKLEKNKKIDEVLCYGNTINQPLPYTKLNQKLDDLGSTTQIDDYLLKIIYYNYYNVDENNKISYPQLVNFIKNKVYDNEEMNSHIDKEMKEDINRLENFTKENTINKKRTQKEIAETFDIDEKTSNDLMIYYNSLHTNTEISLSDFINFMNNYILNSKYASNVDSKTKEQLSMLKKFTNRNLLLTDLNEKDMAKLLNINEKSVKDLYLYYVMSNDINEKLSLKQFVNFVNNYVLNNDNYKKAIDNNVKEKLLLMQKFTDDKIIKKNYKIAEMSNIIGLDVETIKQLYFLKFKSQDNGSKYTIKDFINYVLYLKNNNYLKDMDVTQLESLLQNEDIIKDETNYSAEEMANLLGMNKENILELYALIDMINNNTDCWQMNIKEFISIILNNNEVKNSLDKATLNDLSLLNFVVTSSLNNTLYSYNELANILGINEENVKNIYSLYVANNGIKLTPKNLVDFILKHRNDKALATSLTKETFNELSLLQKIINGVTLKKVYSVDSMTSLLGIDKDKGQLLYSIYDLEYKKKNITLSYKDFVSFLLNNVITNKDYAKNFDNSKINKIKTVKNIMNDSLSKKKYNKNDMIKTLKVLSNDIDKNLIDLLYIYYGSVYEYDQNWNLTVEQFVNYLNEDILTDKRFDDFIDQKKRNDILKAKVDINDAKEMLIGNKYARAVLNTKYSAESKETFNFIKSINKNVGNSVYVIGNSPMAYDLSKSFQKELNLITVLTILFIFIVVLFTFKSAIIPIILVTIIQTAVYLTMGILSFDGGSVYFISLLIVQSILMGATIDYAILYTSYYLESREKMDIAKAMMNSYNKSINTILTSSSILIIVTLIVGHFSTAITAKICTTISRGTLCSTILILLILPELLASLDKFIIKNK